MINENIKEEWRAVKGFEGLYEVSNLGRVKSVERTVIRKNGIKNYVKEKILKPIKKSNGYLTVALSKDGIEKPHLVHRLVALAFIPNPNPVKYTIINHKDENKTNNVKFNLEWCNHLYNLNYGTHNERIAKANSKTVYQYTLGGELVKEWTSTAEVQRQTGWHQTAISACCRNCYIREGNNVYKNYIWSYIPLT